ncbi:MAG: nitrogenase-stabilizing/protective protein NifW, partial [Acetobacteraceae bacterium]
MSIMTELGQLSSAEDFFVALDLPFDPAIVNVARLHILRRMGQYLRGDALDGLDDGA